MVANQEYNNLTNVDKISEFMFDTKMYPEFDLEPKILLERKDLKTVRPTQYSF